MRKRKTGREDEKPRYKHRPTIDLIRYIHYLSGGDAQDIRSITRIEDNLNNFFEQKERINKMKYF